MFQAIKSHAIQVVTKTIQVMLCHLCIFASYDTIPFLFCNWLCLNHVYARWEYDWVEQVKLDLVMNLNLKLWQVICHCRHIKHNLKRTTRIWYEHDLKRTIRIWYEHDLKTCHQNLARTLRTCTWLQKTRKWPTRGQTQLWCKASQVTTTWGLM